MDNATGLAVALAVAGFGDPSSDIRHVLSAADTGDKVRSPSGPRTARTEARFLRSAQLVVYLGRMIALTLPLNNAGRP